MTKVTRETKRWIRNASDERAVANGCRFDESRGTYVLEWMERYLKLYEGEWAGQAFRCHDWQIEALTRIFGWVKWSDRWGRWIRRFRQGGLWVPKKNKKSPTLAAVGLYLLVGDGEQGQKVFFGAKDGSQARQIAGAHAMEMLAQSDELMAECTINKSLCRITHEPTRSFLQPLSSSNSRTQEAKEGLNGSLLIDETHVVDREFMDRVSRAGISRSEPLLLEFSTAGSDTNGYGYERWEYGLGVQAGTIHDDSFFFLGYAAPQNVSDVELEADPIKYGQMANPAWGHTIDPDEFLADFRSSITPRQRALFRQYRLNVWSHATSPWLQEDDWRRCETDLTLNAFEGRRCWAGLDKSKTRDMSSLVLVFPHEDGFVQFPFFWLPEETARQLSAKASFEKWAEEGALQLVPGEVIQDSYIEDVFADLVSRFRIQAVFYDRTFAEDITQRMEGDHGTERVEFKQDHASFAAPIEDYERLVIEGRLRHPGHPVLTWQSRHVRCTEDSKGRKMLAKPKKDDFRKIDGIVAGVMALHGALADQLNGPSIYAKSGSMSL